MPHRIVIDLLGYTGGRGGTETYVRELTARLPALMPDTEWIALANRRGADQVRSFFPGEVCVLSWVGADRVTWALGAVFGVVSAARKKRSDGIWCPANFGPITRSPRRVVTIHDAIYHAPVGTLVTRCVSAATSWLMSRSARTADEVITVSGSAARAITRHMGVSPENITVIPNGAAVPVAPVNAWEEVAGLDVRRGRPIVLSTGNRLPHKNFSGLLRALQTIPSPERPLLVVTGGGPNDPLVRQLVELGLTDDVVLPGWVTPGQLEALYAVADLYVCPSLQEGFGLPVVDALRRGLPVVANDIPVLREVGGSLARYADATSPDALARAMMTQLQTPSLDTDRSSRAEWAARFSWEAAAEAIASVLTRTIASAQGSASRNREQQEG